MQPARVLLVDDEVSILRIFKMALERKGFVTEEARDGREAMDLIRKNSFDVIVSDVNMPGYGGLEFLRGIRERDADVPVILMTGKPTLESSNRAMEYGALRYLHKPVMPGALIEIVDKAVRSHQLARQKREAFDLFKNDFRLDGKREELEAQFAKGLEGLRLAFQPIVHFREQRIVAYEALLRSDERSVANPMVFLDIAARLGKLHELGRAVRTRAAAATPPDGVDLFVNVHPSDLSDDNLYNVNAPLSQIASRVVLELTEQASFEDISDLEARLAKLRRIGFRLALDDLGAGYAGLTHFSRLAPEVAKVDMSLIRDIDSQPKKKSIVASTAKLCAELGALIVVEGVETTAERDTLVELGCDVQQGYLFGRPAADFLPPRW